jgi:hypothetical protein
MLDRPPAWTGSWTNVLDPMWRHVVANTPNGHIERLPSGSWRVKVYAGRDPLTGREIRLRRTCKTERAAQIELGKLLEQADAGRQPETGATAAELMDKYAQVKLEIKALRHYTASQLLAARFDLRNTAERLGPGGGATTLRHYADPVSEVDRRAAAYLASLTAGSTARGD